MKKKKKEEEDKDLVNISYVKLALCPFISIQSRRKI